MPDGSDIVCGKLKPSKDRHVWEAVLVYLFVLLLFGFSFTFSRIAGVRAGRDDVFSACLLVVFWSLW